MRVGQLSRCSQVLFLHMLHVSHSHAPDEMVHIGSAQYFQTFCLLVKSKSALALWSMGMTAQSLVRKGTELRYPVTATDGARAEGVLLRGLLFSWGGGGGGYHLVRQGA